LFIFLLFAFFHSFFTLVVQILWKWKTFYGLTTLLRTQQLPHFWLILKLTWFDFVDPHKVFVRRNAFWASPSPHDGMYKGWKWKVEAPIFTTGTIYKKSLNWFPFQTRKYQGKRWLWWKMKVKKVKKLERKSIVCSKREKKHEKGRKKRTNQRLTWSSHMLITHFLYWTFKLDPKPLDTHSIYYKKKKNLMQKKVKLKVQFASNWS